MVRTTVDAITQGDLVNLDMKVRAYVCVCVCVWVCVFGGRRGEYEDMRIVLYRITCTLFVRDTGM